MYSVKLQNIKGIKEMTFPFPERKGVYLLTGANGCGKTSLLIALCRLGDKNAFTHYRVNSSSGSGPKFDAYEKASVTYSDGNESVTYNRKGIRWTPSPKSKSCLINKFPFVNTLFISTTGMRFFTQSILKLKRPSFTVVDNDIIKPLNDILGTHKFDNLQFLTVKGKKGRQRQLHRNNKLYVIRKAGGDFYTELNFSLGERLLLNTLDELENISPRTLLLIDEVELALHPVAQIRFYDYLVEQANQKNLAVVISTHSSSLIKHAKHRMYMEMEEATGKVNVIEDCYPAFILRSVASVEENNPDFIFFVEDVMAKRYLDTVLRRFLSDLKRAMDIKVLCGGTYEQVVSLVQNFPSLNYEKSRIQAFLDKDVEESYNFLRDKGNNRTDAEQNRFKLFEDNRENISYLSITPELGVWEWIVQHPAEFRIHLDSRYGLQTFDVASLIAQTSTDEMANRAGNLRHWAKGCFKNIAEKIHYANPQIVEKDVANDMISCFVDNNYSFENLKAVLLPLINRR